MATTQPDREREVLKGPLTADYLQQRLAAGWVPKAIEWERSEAPPAGGAGLRAEIPYGMRASAGCQHLEEDPAEIRVLLAMLEGIVEDHSMGRIAESLTARGFETRSGQRWTQVSVFDMLPRLIELSPRLFQHPEWRSRRKELAASGAIPSANRPASPRS